MSNFGIWELYKRFRQLDIDPEVAQELVCVLIMDEDIYSPIPTTVLVQNGQVAVVRIREKESV